VASFQLHTSITTAIKFFFVGLLGYLIALLGLYFLNDRFTLSHITSDTELRSASTAQLSEEMVKILSQPFSYLSQGSQMYVFESQDHKYVIKFFKHQRYRLPQFLLPTALPTFQKKIYDEKRFVKEQKLCHLYNSCQIAINDLYDASGLIYTHLQPTDDLRIKTLLIDKLKRNYHVDLDDLEFVVQKKGTLILPLLTSLIQNGLIEEGKQRIDQLVDLLEHRVQKRIIDSDCVITKNIGFLDDKAIYIDIGQFTKSKEKLTFNTSEDSRIFVQLQRWLENNSPLLAEYLNTTIKHRLHFF
jgi:hypothetical protein